MCRLNSLPSKKAAFNFCFLFSEITVLWTVPVVRVSLGDDPSFYLGMCSSISQWWERNESSSDSTGNASSSGALSLLIMQCFNLSRFNKNIYPTFLLFCSYGSWWLWLLWSVQSCPHCVAKLNYIQWEQQCNEMTPTHLKRLPLFPKPHLIWTVTGQTFGWLELKVFWGSGTMQILTRGLASGYWELTEVLGTAWVSVCPCHK